MMCFTYAKKVIFAVSMNISVTEENYLKAIFSATYQSENRVGNQLIAESLAINPASVTEMLRKLDEKKLIEYNRTNGAKLTKDGWMAAVKVIRKHRLWETFLVDHLNFTWDEVHEVAEQLEHIQSDKLLDELATFLGNPGFDPHGDPIPDKKGKMPVIKSRLLSETAIGKKVKVVKVGDNTASFLKYLDKQGIALADHITVKEVQDFDKSLLVELKGKKEVYLSAEAAKKIMVE
ncbi:metal-dependent transcriptional regulator [Ferruginibacter sp. SUN002]|uniref:metal-dependent transcriptional regulator n=1 Tax=Ferruginibacter sp. SUN002 TaxID=2937789 RepID=UPI003D362DB8